MQSYRMANVTLWQVDEPDQVRGYWSVFIRYLPRDYVTLARGEVTSSAPESASAEQWLIEALETWLRPPDAV